MSFLDRVEEVALGDSKNFQEIRIANSVGEMVTLSRNGKGWTSHNTNSEHIVKKLRGPLCPNKDEGTRIVILSERMRYHASCINGEIIVIAYSRQ